MATTRRGSSLVFEFSVLRLFSKQPSRGKKKIAVLYLPIQRGWKTTTGRSNWGLEPGSCIRSVPSPSRGTFGFNVSNYGRGSQICVFFPPPPCSFRRCWYLAVVISLFAQEHRTGHISSATCATGLAACWRAV